MAASVGPSPFSDYNAYREFRRANKKDITSRWSPDHGWRKQPKKTKTKKVTSTSGNTYEVPDDDLEEYLTYYRTSEGSAMSDTYKEGKGRLKNVETPADYIDYVFGKESKARITEQAGVGHIRRMWYSDQYQLLKVEFTNNGSIVVFFRVPSQLATTLFELAKTGGTRAGVNGRQGHLLGIYFWDLVRIRGSLHGSRYKFEYVKDNGSGGLPGRPFGSGENLYREETGPNKNVEARIEGVRQFREQQVAQKHLLERLASEPQLMEQLREGLGGQSVRSLLKDVELGIEAADERLAELESERHDVTRRIPESRAEAPSRIELPPDSQWGSMSAFDELSDRQKAEITSGMTGRPTPTRARQDAYVRAHMDRREQARLWDVDRLDDYVDTLTREGRLDADRFYKRFTNAGDQFDYLKTMGFIPPNAVYRS